MSSKDFEVAIGILENLRFAGLVVLKVFLSLIFSLIFVMDRHKLKEYLEKVEKSNFSFLYREYSVIFEKISNTFGLVFKAQAIVAM